MIVALERLTVAGAFEDDLAPAMATHVGECVEYPIVTSRDYDWDVTELSREKIAGVIDLSGVSCVLP
jgi:hypothetical protein